jgi:transcriptional regulator of arginine metabolism
MLGDQRGIKTEVGLCPRRGGAALLTVSALICNMHATLCRRGMTLIDHHQADRRQAVVRLLAHGNVHKQQELVRLLRKQGYAATQSSISRDLREIGVSKARGRYVLPPAEVVRANGKFGALAQFVQQVKRAGPCMTVVRTSTGAAQSVAVAIDKAQWPEVIGTLSGDDTIFIASASARAQAAIVDRLRALFRI